MLKFSGLLSSDLSSFLSSGFTAALTSAFAAPFGYISTVVAASRLPGDRRPAVAIPLSQHHGWQQKVKHGDREAEQPSCAPIELAKVRSFALKC